MKMQDFSEARVGSGWFPRSLADRIPGQLKLTRPSPPAWSSRRRDIVLDGCCRVALEEMLMRTLGQVYCLLLWVPRQTGMMLSRISAHRISQQQSAKGWHAD